MSDGLDRGRVLERDPELRRRRPVVHAHDPRPRLVVGAARAVRAGAGVIRGEHRAIWMDARLGAAELLRMGRGVRKERQRRASERIETR